jgi:hypothetical protein
MEFAYPLEWKTAQNINNLIECNIMVLENKLNYSPFCIFEPNEARLYKDTMPHYQTIIDINRAGFMTLDSQPSSKETYFTSKPDPEDCCGFVIKHTNNDLKDDGDKSECIEYQRAYCDGFIHKYQFEKFKDNIKKNYNLYYYNKFTGECEDDYINLTYLEFNDCKHCMTNFDDAEDFYVDYYLPLVKQYVNEDLCKIFEEEMIFIAVIDFDYNTGKNIYKDVLDALQE